MLPIVETKEEIITGIYFHQYHPLITDGQAGNVREELLTKVRKPAIQYGLSVYPSGRSVQEKRSEEIRCPRASVSFLSYLDTSRSL